MKDSRIKKNLALSLGGQALLMLLAIIVPRLMIGNYGTDASGFLSTLTQIFGYVALLQSGIGQAAKNALFKPLAEKDRCGISYVLSVADRYFKRVSLIYGLCVIILAIICPIVIKTEMLPATIIAIVIIEGASGVINFYFISSKSMFFSADGKSYINQSINLFSNILFYAIKIVLAALGVPIVILQAGFLGITIIKVFSYECYFRKNYNWVSLQAAPKSAKMKDRSYYVVNEIAWTIFFSTDMIVLSTFVSAALSGVYAIYNLIINSINTLWKAAYFGLTYLLGQAFHRDRTQYMKLHNGFTSAFFGGMTILMCTAYILMIPFIKLYTAGVADVEYIYPALPLLFCLVQMISWSRFVSSNLLWLSGNGKIISRISIITAAMNVVISVVLVNFYGIVGVLLGTVIALPIKVVCVTWISEKKILQRNPIPYIIILATNYLYFFAVVYIGRFVELPINGYLSFVGYGAIVFMACAIIGILLNMAANPDCLHFLRSIINTKKHVE